MTGDEWRALLDDGMPSARRVSAGSVEVRRALDAIPADGRSCLSNTGLGYELWPAWERSSFDAPWVNRLMALIRKLSDHFPHDCVKPKEEITGKTQYFWFNSLGGSVKLRRDTIAERYLAVLKAWPEFEDFPFGNRVAEISEIENSLGIVKEEW